MKKAPPMKRGPKHKYQKQKMKTKKGKLGKAAALPGKLWCLWLGHALSNGRCWLYVALLVSHLLCLRITECLTLKAEDFAFTAGTVHIGSLKGQAAMRKPMVSGVKSILQKLKRHGVSRKRREAKGSRGLITWWDRWHWPVRGALFPSDRADCFSDVRNKNTVCKAISRLRKSFEQATDRPIRPHSGRHTMINMLKGAGIPDEIGMFYARINDKQTYAGYGAFTPTQASALLKKSKNLRKCVADVYGANQMRRNSPR